MPLAPSLKRGERDDRCILLFIKGLCEIFILNLINMIVLVDFIYSPFFTPSQSASKQPHQYHYSFLTCKCPLAVLAAPSVIH